MNKSVHRKVTGLQVILCFGLLPALVCQYFAREPGGRYIHVRNFRYGKDPSVIRCNRGDTLHLTLSTDDTGHSFFLEEFDVDAKVSPARDMVELFKASDPTQPSIQTREVTIVARHPGIQNWLVSKSYYRCHVWCGPMHAFEHGKLVIFPNTLMFFSLGCIAGIIFLWLIGFRRRLSTSDHESRTAYRDLLEKNSMLRKLVTSRWPQLILTILAMVMVYVVILAAFFGTKMSGRNLGVLLMWAIWLFLLVAILTPFLGRIWCTICPLPFFGDLFQRRSALVPQKGSSGGLNHSYRGFFLKWPRKLRNGWSKLILLLILTTFSATLVANPKVTGSAVLLLVLVPTILSVIFEKRAFCRYLCPVSTFIGPFSRLSPLALRNRSQKVCDRCKKNYCELGSKNGWACPYGLNVGELNENTECGLCMECTRSCLYNNVSLYTRPVASEAAIKTLSDAWTAIVVFLLAVVYSVLYQGHWPEVRDFVNILDKQNWDLFGYYTIVVWFSSLLGVPGIIFGLSFIAKKISATGISTKEVFMNFTGALLPLGLTLWMAFVIPMLFANTTFVLQSLSDPLGWGWDFFGTANIPWHQFLPRTFPWLQGILVVVGLFLSLRNLRRNMEYQSNNPRQSLLLALPMALFIAGSAIYMTLFFTN